MTYKARLALAGVYDMNINQFHVKTALINCDLKEDIFMEQPERFINDNAALVYKCSSQCWNEKFVQFIKLFDFKHLYSDNCMFCAQVDRQEGFVSVSVDDGLILSKSTIAINKIIEEFNIHFENVVDDPSYLVGLDIWRDCEPKQLFTCQLCS
ncbi:uncharacterized protein LOC126355557 [Schistocerca gregaria]|uniref:uncharacterized protein LOC126355557 n=1 Tax=Schistocerca gregaria TaxID=7010 RepID=UPI00211DCF66|nr:uncharacterized protein LOC126355557 [Schistocerca gregaria]